MKIIVTIISTAWVKNSLYPLSQQTFVLMKTSWRCLSSSSSEDVFKMSCSKRIYSPSSYVFRGRFQEVFKMSWSRPTYSSWSYVFKTSSRCFQDVFKTSSRRFQDVLQKRLQDVFKRYHQVKLLLLTSFRDVFSTFLRSTAKTVSYRRICLGHTSGKFMVSVQNLQEW